MTFLLYYLFSVVIAAYSTNALLCHWCSHRNSKEAARLQIHDRVQSTPDWCEEHRICEGTWCTQSLVGGNVSFGCTTDQSPLQYIWQVEKINSHCTASFDAEGISHASCWCKSRDFCNLAPATTNFTTTTFLLLVVISHWLT